MASTYKKINSSNITTNTASVTFSSIPQTYTDLVLVVSTISSGTTSQLGLRFNGDTGNNYSYNYYIADTSSVFSGKGASFQSYANAGGAGITNTTINIINIPGYTSTTQYKSSVGLYGFYYGSYGEVGGKSTTWQSTGAISSITMLIANGASFTNGDSMSLYGILAA